MTPVPKLTDGFKRVLVGRALHTNKLGETLLPKKLALPVFASDAMSSVSYATQEIVLVFALAGTAYLALSWWAALAVIIVMVTVISAYRQNVKAYPSGGGDYEIANVNLGRRFGMVVAAALMVDYVLTVAVSASAGIDNLASTPLFAWLGNNPVASTLGVVGLVVLMNLRGIRESGTAFAIPAYAFMFSILGMIAFGVYRIASGDDLVANSAQYEIEPAVENLGVLGLAFLGMRAFASGCTALTGVEAISNGVPAFKEPKSRNAANTLAIMGAIAITMFAGITYLAIKMQVHYVEEVEQLVGYTESSQPTVIAQVAATVFGGDNNIFFYIVQLATAIILVLAANTAFNGFPVLASILAQDRYMPRQMHTRGDRLVFSNGIVFLAAAACLLIWIFDANSSALIQLYIVGVFVSFTCSQAGMTRHWNRALAETVDVEARKRILRLRALSFFAFCMTGTVLTVILITRFVHGAWLAVVFMTALWFLMRAIHGHYERVSAELVADPDLETTLPSRVHAIVLVSKVHKPTLRAVSYARASRPTTLEAVTVNVDAVDTRALQLEWDRRDIPVPLKVLDSPFREVTRPVVEYVRGLRRHSPRDIVTVYIPEYVVGHWWEQLLHNQSALRLKGRLLFTPGVMVVSVPWQLVSSEAAARRPEPSAPGDVRRGQPPPAVADAIVDAEYADGSDGSDDPRG
jgi:amino acid transporter